MTPAQGPALVVCGQAVDLTRGPRLMGIVNATPDSFSDGGATTLGEQVAVATRMLEAGASIIDIGGESGVTNRPAVSAQEEIERVVPLIERVAGELGALVSVDTYKPEVARAAIAAGARIVNDVSGLRDERLAGVCADSGAGLVIMHTRVAPKVKLEDPSYPAGVVSDVAEFLAARMEVAISHGVAAEQILLDPGPDFAKTPRQTVDALRGIDVLAALGRPLLLAISRKDFIGALTGRPPRERLAGTLAALGFAADHGAAIVRVHDVAQAADYLAVRAALQGELEPAAALRLDDSLRWDQGDADPLDAALSSRSRSAATPSTGEES